ncbi:hypothetical protein JOC27_001156 [Sporolactobacillus spathodeae]|uniref:Uncharacterized protein n=1 Tax=Sporolactobacillus spathodeae TaxID=1465502 RepID=A0ABS2Q7E0_9BACL|nr:hypothetical protein [Sporolactobacillus spathodeae]
MYKILHKKWSEGARRLREQRAGETPQVLVCLRRLAVRPRQASDRSAFAANKDLA